MTERTYTKDFFKNKITTPLEVQLNQAIQQGKINDVYRVSKTKSVNESDSEFIQRLVTESSEYQFVKLIDSKGEIRYAAFGTPGPIVTDDGEFQMITGQIVGGDWGVQTFLIYPNLLAINDKQEIFVRIDSGCFSGMVLGDNTCDCKSQFDQSKKECVKHGAGIVISVPAMDGRGWPEHKMALQRIEHELDIDTVDTAREFYGSDEVADIRDFTETALLYSALGISKNMTILLGTGNKKKVLPFQELGFDVVKDASIKGENLNEAQLKYVKAKTEKWGNE